MKLGLTKRGDYAVRAALALARHASVPGFTKIQQVVDELGLPPRYTPQILGLLAKAGLAESRAGRDGGYRLLRDPEDISLLEVVEAAEGPLATEECTLRGGPCHWQEMCAIHPAWEEATQALRSSLANVSLADLVDVDTGLATGRLKAPRDAHRARQRANRKRRG